MNLKNTNKAIRLINQMNAIKEEIKGIQEHKIKKIVLSDRSYDDGQKYTWVLRIENKYILQPEEFIQKVVRDYIIQMRLELTVIERELTTL